jgi:hypothetical protein
MTRNSDSIRKYTAKREISVTHLHTSHALGNGDDDENYDNKCQGKKGIIRSHSDSNSRQSHRQL